MEVVLEVKRKRWFALGTGAWTRSPTCANGRGGNRRHVVDFVGLMTAVGILGLPATAHAQTIGATEAEFVRVFDTYTTRKSGVMNDGTARTVYAHPSKVRYLALWGPANALVGGALFTPMMAAGASGDVAAFGAFTVLVCQGDRCDAGNVLQWVGAQLQLLRQNPAGLNAKSRFGRIDFEMTTGDDNVAFLMLSADARPSFREADLERERAAAAAKKEQERQDAAKAWAEIEAAAKNLTTDAPPAAIERVLYLARGAQSPDDARQHALVVSLASRAVQARLHVCESILGKGELETAEECLAGAQRLMTDVPMTADDGVNERINWLQSSIVYARAKQAESRGALREARASYLDVATRARTTSLHDEAVDGVSRIDAHKKSPALATALSVIPGTGQFYSGSPVVGGIQLGGFVIGGGLGALGMGFAVDAYSQYKSASNAADAQGRYHDVQAWETVGIIGLGVAGACWLWSVIDAHARANEWNRMNIGVE